MRPLISVPIPTVPGRESSLARAIASYRASARVQLIVIEDSPTCGAGWTLGADQARGDYIAFGADDVEMLPGWWEAAAGICDAGGLPAAVVLNADGSLQSCGGSWQEMEPDGAVTRMSRTPVIRREWWDFVGPIPHELHYFTDDWVSERCRRRGILPTVSHSFRYIHHLASERRGAGMGESARMDHDRALYTRLIEEAV